MLWLIGQIAVFLIIAAIIGFIVGWLLRALWPSTSARAREGELESALERASGRISHLEAGLRAKRVAAAAAAEQEQAALRRVEELEAALATLHSEGKTDTGEVVDLQEELDEALDSIKTLRREMSDVQARAAEIATLRAEHDAALDGVSESEAADPQQGGLFLVPDDTSEDDHDPEESVSTASFEWDDEEPSLTAPVEELGEEEIEAQRLEAVARVTEQFRLADDAPPDDLKRIYGIGPVLERLLHSMNIKTFRQIAEFTDDDIDLVSAALGRAFPDRIRRDDWVGGAWELLDEDQEGEES